MDLGTLTNATAELLLFGLVAGVVLTGLTWLLIRTLRSLTAATTYLMLYLTLVAILLVPIFKALPEFPTTRQGTPNIISDLAEAPVAPVATAEGPAAQPTPALEVSTATLSPPVPSPQYRPPPPPRWRARQRLSRHRHAPWLPSRASPAFRCQLHGLPSSAACSSLAFSLWLSGSCAGTCFFTAAEPAACPPAISISSC